MAELQPTNAALDNSSRLAIPDFRKPITVWISARGGQIFSNFDGQRIHYEPMYNIVYKTAKPIFGL
jgi:hypothetical protein